MPGISHFQVLMDKISHVSYIHPDSLPRMELYMDQVTHFMEEKLGKWRRSADDKVLTHTMINNYTKNKLVPPPVKKKYDYRHLLTLNYIFYLKSFLSIKDIGVLLQPLTERFWERASSPDMKSIYREILKEQARIYPDILKSIRKSAAIAEETFEKEELSEEDASFLKKFVLICLLSFDISLKKRMIESLIDDMKA